MRLGILGGSFNPVHYGHLLMAECALESCRLDEVWLMPAAVAPHKQSAHTPSAEMRIEMLQLAIGGDTRLKVSDMETRRGGVSYTVDTLRQLQQEDPGRHLFFILGADSLRDLPHWREPAEICQLALLAVIRRADWPEPNFSVLSGLVSAERIALFQKLQVEMPLIELSSSDLRQRVAEGRSIRFRTPRAVETYIEMQGLYRATD